MSQIYKSATGSSPAIPTQFTADDSTVAVPVGNNLNLLSRDTEEDNLNGIQTTVDLPGSDDFYIELTNRIQTLVAAPQGVTTDLVTFDLGPDAAVYRFTFNSVGRDLSNGNGAGYTVLATFKTDGAAATIIRTPWIDADEDVGRTACLIGMIASGNNAVLQFTVPAGNNMSVMTVGTYIKV